MRGENQARRGGPSAAQAKGLRRAASLSSGSARVKWASLGREERILLRRFDAREKRLNAERDRRASEILDRLASEELALDAQTKAAEAESAYQREFRRRLQEAKERKIDAFLAKQLKEVGIEDPRTTRRPRGSASQPPTRGCLYSAENRTESPRPADESLVAAEAEGDRGNARPVRTIPRRVLSERESRLLEEALLRQQRAILEGEPQRAAGRVHSGPCFSCRPSVIKFEGFKVGNEYSQVVEVTNVSLSFSAFRVLPLPEEIQDSVAVEVKPPGRMSAGTSAHLKVFFRPKSLKDLDSHIPLLTPTGLQKFPLLCRRTRPVLSFTPAPLSPSQVAELVETLLSSPSSISAVRKKPGHRPEPPVSSALRTGASSSSPPVSPLALESESSAAVSSKKQTTPRDCGTRVIHLSAGAVQLGEVAAARLRLKNSGDAFTSYRVCPLLPPVADDASSSEDAGGGSREQRGLGDGTESLDAESAAENSDSEAASARAESVSPPVPSGDPWWVEALRDESLVLAERLIAPESREKRRWAQVCATGFDALLEEEKQNPPTSSPSPRRRGAAASVEEEEEGGRFRAIKTAHTMVKYGAGELRSKGSRDVAFFYAPTDMGRFVGFFLLQFSEASLGELLVVLSGACVKPAVSVACASHDLGVCVPGRTYRQDVFVRNSQGCARALTVVAPSAEEGVLWVEPSSSIVQARGSATLTINFAPSFAFLRSHPHFARPLPPAIRKTHPNSAAFCIPVKIRASEQILCAETALAGILTERDLQVRPSAFDFGSCDGGVCYTRRFEVFNPSLLVAHYEFRAPDRGLFVFEAVTADCLDSAEARLSPRGSGVYAETAEARAASARTQERVSGEAEVATGSDSEEAGAAFDVASVVASRLSPVDCGGVGALLPGERRELVLLLDAAKLRTDAQALQLLSGKAVAREGSVRLRVVVGNQTAYETKLPWRARLTPPLIQALPASALRLPVTPLGSRVSASVEIKCVASQLLAPLAAARPTSPLARESQPAALIVQVALPPRELSALDVSPQLLLLTPAKRKATLHLAFSPDASYFFLDDEAAGRQQTQTLREAAAVSSETNVPPSRVSRQTPETREDRRSPSVPAKQGRSPKAAVSAGETEAKNSADASRREASAGEAPEGGVAEEKDRERDAERSGKADGTLGEERRKIRCRQVLKRVIEEGGVRWASLREDGMGILDFYEAAAFQHASWQIPLRTAFLSAKQKEQFVAAGNSYAPFADSLRWVETFLEASTCATPELVKASPQELAFGSVMVGQRVLKTLTLSACTDLALSFRFQVQALPLGCCFSVASAEREVQPKKPLTLRVAFSPNKPTTFRAELVLVAARTRVSIPLTGEGVGHTVDVSPALSLFDLGAVSCKNAASVAASTSFAFSLTNRTSVELPFHLRRVFSPCPQLEDAKAFASADLFVCEPFKGVLPPLGSAVVTVDFTPQRAEGWLREDFELELATGGSASRRISFVGLATAGVLYAMAPPAFADSREFSFGSGEAPSSEGCLCAAKKSSLRGDSGSRSEGREAPCLCCSLEELPRLAGERGLLEESATGFSLWQAKAAAPVASASKTAQTPPAPPLPQSGVEEPQALELRFAVARTQTRSSRGKSADCAEESAEAAAEYFAGESLSALRQTAASRAILVGAAWPPGKRRQPPFASNKVECAGSFEVSMEPSPAAHLFSFDPPKGQLFFGKRQFVLVSVSLPPEGTPSATFREGLPEEAFGSQVLEATAKLWLRPTGSVSGAPQEISIRLSAHIK